MNDIEKESAFICQIKNEYYHTVNIIALFRRQITKHKKHKKWNKAQELQWIPFNH